MNNLIICYKFTINKHTFGDLDFSMEFNSSVINLKSALILSNVSLKINGNDHERFTRSNSRYYFK